MRGTVVVTRPTGQNGSLARRLGDAGWSVLLLPVFEIAPLADGASIARAWRRIGEYDLIHFTSANAIRHFFDHRPAEGRGAFKPGALLAVMGPGSRGVVAPRIEGEPVAIVTPGQELGAVEPAALDSETLMVTLDTLMPAGMHGLRVLMVRGEGGRDWLAGALADAGARVEGLPVYRRLCPTLTVAQLAELENLRARLEPTAFVVTSSEGVQNLATMLAPHEEIGDFVRGVLVVVTHARVAQRAKTLGFRQVKQVAPNDDAVVRTIESTRSPSTRSS